MRVAGVLTPVSRRYFVIDSVAALPRPVDTATAVVPEVGPAVVDTSGVPFDTLAAPPDTLGVPFDTLAAPPDTLGVPIDTLAVDTLRVPRLR